MKIRVTTISGRFYEGATGEGSSVLGWLEQSSASDSEDLVGLYARDGDDDFRWWIRASQIECITELPDKRPV